MAHQTDVHVIHCDFKSKSAPEQVVDPVCGIKLDRRTARHVVFRENETAYFCSRECKDSFLSPGRVKGPKPSDRSA